MTDLFSDDFNRTVSANGWGNSWTTAGSPSPYSVNGSAGLVSGGSFGNGLEHAIGSTVTDWEILLKWRSTNSGEPMFIVHNGTSGYGVRMVTWGNQYKVNDTANVSWNNDGYQTVSPSLSNNTWYWTRLRYVSGTLSVRLWADGGSEPGTWDYSGSPPHAYSNFTTIWLGCWGSTNTEFDSVLITDGAAGGATVGGPLAGGKLAGGFLAGGRLAH